MDIFTQLIFFFQEIGTILFTPSRILVLFGSTFLGILFGAMPGLTATLGVALLTGLTYGMNTTTALTSLLGIYVGAVYGGSYGSIMLNIPGTASAAATALDGFPLCKQGKAGVALGLTTTASSIGTMIGMIFVIAFTPLISSFALRFTSVEFFLLAFFGIIISGSISTPDIVIKGWLAGFFGLFLSSIGRELLQFYPRFTFGSPNLDSGIEVVPVLIGAFGIPQVIQILKDGFKLPRTQKVGKITPSWGTIAKNFPHIVRSALIGVGIGSVPGIGEDIAGWVSYGTARKVSKNPERFGKGEYAGIIASETANNACIGGAMIPLLSLGIPGSPPAAILLGAFMLHGISPGPMLQIEQPTFIIELAAILFLATIIMYIIGINLAKRIIKLLTIPSAIFMPIVALLCIIGSYSLNLKMFNLYIMIPIGLICYYFGEFGYPIPPLVIGVILGNMSDINLRRALMGSDGDLAVFVTRPVAAIFLTLILWSIISQSKHVKRLTSVIYKKTFQKLMRR